MDELSNNNNNGLLQKVLIRKINNDDTHEWPVSDTCFVCYGTSFYNGRMHRHEEDESNISS